MAFWKQVLSPGIYWTQEGPVKFSAADCASLVSRGKEMLAAGLAVPVPLEHQDVRPVDQATRLANTVLHNAGWVDDYKVDSQNRAWAHLDIPDPKLASRLHKTIKFVSPEIDRFTDGTGRDWGRVITHVALTTTPVDASQEPFAGDGASVAPTTPATVQAAAHALRWSLAKGPLRFSLASAVQLSKGRWQAVHPEQVRLSGATMPEKKPAELETEEPEIPETEGTETPEAKPEPPGSADTGHFGEALKVLEEHGIKLPPSTSPENFFERLCVAGHCLRDQPDETPEEPEKPEPIAMTQQKVPQEEPQTVAMSLQKKDAEIGRLQAELAEERFKGVSQAIDGLVAKGQIPGAKAKGWREKLGAKRLSLVQGNETVTREILAQIELAKEIPEGTFWSPEVKTARLSRQAQPEEAPEYVRFDRDEDLKNMPAERVKKIADEAFGPAA